MKKFIDPICEIQQFVVQDVITTSNSLSGGGDVGGSGDTEW